MSKKHWLELLPEAGRHFEFAARSIRQRQEHIERINAQATQYAAEITRIENDAIELIRANSLWTEQEIAQAKKEATT